MSELPALCSDLCYHAGMAKQLTTSELNRLFASRGGKARAAKLSKARRREIAVKASMAAAAKRRRKESK